MRHKTSAFILLFPVALFISLACGKKSEEQTTVQETQAICIMEGISLRASPSQQGKWLSSISLGEKVVYLGATAVDSADNNREYCKVRLSDGKEGWAFAWPIIPNAKAAAVLQKSVIYKRPDLLTSTATELSPMTMVAVKSEKEDWIEMVTSKKEKSGWVKNNVVSYKDEDVAVAILVAKAMAEKDAAKQKEKLEAILNNPSFAGSVFIEELRNRLYSGQAPTDTATVVEEDHEN